jgi:hypothetical protein
MSLKLVLSLDLISKIQEPRTKNQGQELQPRTKKERATLSGIWILEFLANSRALNNPDILIAPVKTKRANSVGWIETNRFAQAIKKP